MKIMPQEQTIQTDDAQARRIETAVIQTVWYTITALAVAALVLNFVFPGAAFGELSTLQLGAMFGGYTAVHFFRQALIMRAEVLGLGVNAALAVAWVLSFFAG